MLVQEASEGIASPGVWTPFAVEASVKLSEVQSPADLQPDYMQAGRSKALPTVMRRHAAK